MSRQPLQQGSRERGLHGLQNGIDMVGLEPGEGCEGFLEHPSILGSHWLMT